MKAIRLLLLTIVSAGAMSRGLYAAPGKPSSDQTASQSAPAAAVAQRDSSRIDGNHENDAQKNSQPGDTRRGSEKLRARSKATAAKPALPQATVRQRILPEAGNFASVRSSARAQFPAAVNHGTFQNEPIYRALPVRPGGMVRPVVPSVGNLRHRDPNTSVIGGTASSKGRNTAVIDGTRISLKASRN